MDPTTIVEISDKGPTKASNFTGGFDFFFDHWGAVGEFYFDVHFFKQLQLQQQPFIVFEVAGLAICCENSPVYYVNFSKDLVTSGKLNICDIRVVAPSIWKRIVKIMGQGGARKILTFAVFNSFDSPSCLLTNLRYAYHFTHFSYQRAQNICKSFKQHTGINLLAGSIVYEVPKHTIQQHWL